MEQIGPPRRCLAMATPTQKLRSIQPGRGRMATSPLGIPLSGWKDIAYRLFVGFGQNRILLTSAGVNYFLLMALVPSLSLFVSLYGLLNDPAGVLEQLDLLEGLVPPGGLDIIRDQLLRLTSQDAGALGLTLFLSLGVAFWSASAGVKALFEAMNVVYGESEKRNFFQVTALALVFILGGLVMVVLMLAVVVVLPVVLRLFSLSRHDWLVQLGAYGVMLACLLAALAAIYRWGPSRQEARWRWISVGSCAAALSIVVMSAGFSWYAANFSNYNATYGSLGALIGLLTWMWLSVTIVILGGALNSEIEHQTTVDSTTGDPAPMGDRGAYVADTVGGRWPASNHEAGRSASDT